MYPGYPDISPRMYSSIYAELTVINPTSIYGPNYFHQSHFHFNKERFSSNVRVGYIIFGLISSYYYVFSKKQRFLSSVQFLVNNELFNQSSFYLRNIVLSFQLLFQQRYTHFSPGGEVREGNVRGGMS